MLLFTQTIASEDYLHHYGIHRNKEISSSAFTKTMKSKLESQIKKTKKVDKTSLPKPGIYPSKFGKDSVHFYAIRNEKGLLVIGNGYPSRLGINSDVAVGLDAQKDHSHGFCMIFALIFYHRDEKQLSKMENKEKRYRKNIDIGLKWADEFTKEHPWEWGPNELKNMLKLNKENISNVSTLRFFFPRKNTITINDVVKKLRDPKYKKYLDEWFAGDPS
jgi:hypothetical protein